MRWLTKAAAQQAAEADGRGFQLGGWRCSPRGFVERYARPQLSGHPLDGSSCSTSFICTKTSRRKVEM
jgi:hypothetical protein